MAWLETRKIERALHKKGLQIKDALKKKREWLSSQLADPSQNLRLTGTAMSAHPDGELHCYHENEQNLTIWPGDQETRIDRFDCRASLDYLPSDIGQTAEKSEPDVDLDDLNFERYRDLVELQRAQVEDASFLQHLDCVWNEKLLKKRRSSRRIAEDEPPLPGEILDEDEVYQFLKIITDEQIKELDELGSDYGIASLYEKLKASKREDETREAKALALEEKKGDRGHKKKKNKALEYGAGKKRTSVGNSFTKDGDGSAAPFDFEEGRGDSFEEERTETEATPVRKTSTAAASSSAPAPAPATNAKLTPLQHLKQRARLALESQSKKDEIMKQSKEVHKQQQARWEREGAFSGPFGAYAPLSSADADSSKAPATIERH
ncbi:hypothetical protein SeLEV6574_g03717, partial [Synchytrium endobioticum]